MDVTSSVPKSDQKLNSLFGKMKETYIFSISQHCLFCFTQTVLIELFRMLRNAFARFSKIEN